jgi:hypothetical protein
MKRRLQKHVGDIRVVVSIAGPQTDEELDQYIAEAVAMAPHVRAVLVVTSGEMTAVERSKMAKAGLYAFPTATLTDSPSLRFMLTAIRWLGGSKVAGFGLHQLDAACAFLQIPLSLVPQIYNAMESMKAELGWNDGQKAAGARAR